MILRSVFLGLVLTASAFASKDLRCEAMIAELGRYQAGDTVVVLSDGAFTKVVGKITAVEASDGRLDVTVAGQDGPVTVNLFGARHPMGDNPSVKPHPLAATVDTALREGTIIHASDDWGTKATGRLMSAERGPDGIPRSVVVDPGGGQPPVTVKLDGDRHPMGDGPSVTVVESIAAIARALKHGTIVRASDDWGTEATGRIVAVTCAADGFTPIAVTVDPGMGKPSVTVKLDRDRHPMGDGPSVTVVAVIDAVSRSLRDGAIVRASEGWSKPVVGKVVKATYAADGFTPTSVEIDCGDGKAPVTIDLLRARHPMGEPPYVRLLTAENDGGNDRRRDRR